MSTDDRMHERLTRAGALWRDANAALAHVDLAAITTPEHGEAVVPITPAGTDGPRRPRRHRVQMWLAAAVGAAAAASVVIVVANLGGGGTPDRQRTAEGGTSLVDTSWTLTDMRGPNGTPLAVVAPAPLKFTKDTISGTDACNSISGKVTIRASDVVLGAIASTEMGCIDRPAGFDAEVAHIHAVLAGTVQWSITGDVLTLTKPGAGTLVYGHEQPTRTTDPAVLANTAWQLALITQGATATSPNSSVSATSPTASISLIVNKNGTLTLTHRCYEVAAMLSAADAKLRLTGIRSLQHSCPQIVDPATRAAQENEDALVDSVFRGTPSWFIDGGQLTVGDTLVFKNPAGEAACSSEGPTRRFALGSAPTLSGTVPVGSIVEVAAEFGTRALSTPKTSSTALVAECNNTVGHTVTAYFRAAHAGTADVIATTTDGPTRAQLTFVVHITVIDAPDYGSGVATASGVTQGPGSASPGSPGSAGSAGSPASPGPILYK